MNPLDRRELAERLSAALDAPETTEIVHDLVLAAGLLARLRPEDPLLDRAVAWRDGPGRFSLAALRRDLDVPAAVDLLADDPVAGVQALDSLATMLTFIVWDAGSRHEYRAAEAVLQMFPEELQGLAGEASRRLQQAPPLSQDPMSRLWQLVEVCAVAGRPEVSGRLGPEVLRALGEPVVIELADFRAELAAATEARVRWTQLAQEDTWAVALVADHRGRAVVVEHAAEVAVVASRDGGGVEGERDGGFTRFVAQAGAWTVQVGDAAVEFELR